MMEDNSISAMVLPELKTTWRLHPNSEGTGFRVWRNRLDDAFLDNEVQYVLEGHIPDKESDPKAHRKFLDDDTTARHIILGSLHEDLYLSHLHHDTAKSLLDALTSLFAKPSMAKRISLLKRYVGHKMGEGASAVEHVFKMERMAGCLKTEGVDLPGELQAVVLMNSLPDSWYDVVTSITVNMDGDEEKMKLKNVEDIVTRVGVNLPLNH